MEDPARQSGVQSVEVAGTILRAMLRAHGPSKLSELSRATDIPTAKLRRYMISLIRIGLAQQSEADGRYDLGPLGMEIGLQSFSRFDVLKQAEQVLVEIVEACGETAAIGQLQKEGPSFVRIEKPRHSSAYPLPENHVCPLTFSATGLLLCAFSDVASVREMIEAELSQSRLSGRPNAPHDRAQLDALVDQVRRRGVSIVEEAGVGASSAMSAPVFGPDGRLVFALTIFAHAGRLNLDPEGDLVAMLAAKARNLSASLGYTGQVAA